MRHKLRGAVIRIGAIFWYAFSCLVPKRSDYILINAFPDFDDTVRSFVRVMRGTDLKLIVLTIEKDAVPPSWIAGACVKVAYRYSAQGIWFYHRSKFVFFTHGIFSFWKTSPQQKVVNLWHGMPIKKIGLLDGKRACDIPRFNYTIAYSDKFRTIISNAFGVVNNRILISPHPRIDGMAETAGINQLELPSHEFLSIWLPTYRASRVGDVRVDGDISADIFNAQSDLSDIDELFKIHRCVCIVKPHPMSQANRDLFRKYSNIIFVDDRQLIEIGVTLYQLLGQASFLITDISSVYFDYKYTAQPVIVYCPDFDAYKLSRGFVSPINNLIDDSVAVSRVELIANLKDLFVSDSLKKKRHSFNFTKRLLSVVGVAPLIDESD